LEWFDLSRIVNDTVHAATTATTATTTYCFTVRILYL
jgi:hypothetical protein